MREARPRQIAARVELSTFRQMSALRSVLNLENGELITRGIALLIDRLSAPQRKAFDNLLALVRD